VRTGFDQAECQNLKNALSKEWLETNGLGGFAASTIIGANTRRHHGLLVAALKPPLGRYVLLSKLEERVICDGHECHISTNLYPGTVFPHGFNVQTEFRPHPWPTFRYDGYECQIEKSLFLVHGENTVVIRYRNVRTSGSLELKVRPFLAFRSFDTLARRDESVSMAVEHGGGVVSVQPRPNLPRLYFYAEPDELEEKADWYYRFTYPAEQEQGLPAEEDLFSPFEMTFQIGAGQTITLVVSTEKKDAVDGEAVAVVERQRRQHFERETDPVFRALLIAADAFLAKRGDAGQTIMAGFPWRTDSSRHTMIALPGLTLVPQRFDVAFQILKTYARLCHHGLLPNAWTEEGGHADYGSVDAPLWFLLAAWHYWKTSGDTEGTRHLLPALRAIVRQYREGTRYDIGVDSDGLIHAGVAGSTLTWMDVKADGYVPTSRHGKPVEVNALWLNALLLLSEMEEKLERDPHAAALLRQQADSVAASFLKTFWNAEDGSLYDVVRSDMRDSAIRPNQILAISLPHTALNTSQQQTVFQTVTNHLLTPYGLRTLSPKSDRYCGRCTGNRRQRNSATHQGSVWPWLIGPYCDAYVKLHGLGRNQRKEIQRVLQPLLDHLEKAALGTVAELFDGDAPYTSRGCFAQAWSVAELLRVYDAYLR